MEQFVGQIADLMNTAGYKTVYFLQDILGAGSSIIYIILGLTCIYALMKASAAVVKVICVIALAYFAFGFLTETLAIGGNIANIF